MLDIGYSLAERAVFGYRAVVVSPDRTDMLAGLAAVAAGTPHPGVRAGKASAGGTAFVFTRQGAQRLGMGRGLYQVFPAFAEAFDAVVTELDRHLDLHLDRPLREVLWGTDANQLDQTVYAQAGLFAVEVALFQLLQSWGIRPQVLAGHSIGELA